MTSVYRRTIISLLKENGAKLIRQAKHKVYRLSNGKNYVEASTPSVVSDLNQLSNLRKVLDLPNSRGQEGERREKKPKFQKRPEHVQYQKFNSTLADQLSLQGLKESILQQEIDSLRDELSMTVYHSEVLEQSLQKTQAELIQAQAALTETKLKISHCWGCRLRAWIGYIRTR